MCIDYLTVLPATFRDDLPLNAAQHQRILALADDLNGALAAAARHQQVELVSASQHSVECHAWSGDPWTTGWSNPISVARIGVPPEIVDNATTTRDATKASSEVEHQLLGTKSLSAGLAHFAAINSKYVISVASRQSTPKLNFVSTGHPITGPTDRGRPRWVMRCKQHWTRSQSPSKAGSIRSPPTDDPDQSNRNSYTLSLAAIGGWGW